MGYWITISGNKYNVNIENDLIKAMKNQGVRFCWMKDTPGIKNKNNKTFYETKTEKNVQGQKQGQEDSRRALRNSITVIAENGEQVTGYIIHWVLNMGNKTPATDIQEWFIMQPGTYPTQYIVKKTTDEIVITEL